MRRLALILTLLLGAGACSVPTEDTAQVIDQEELPESLRNTQSTTTTTIAAVTETFTYFLLQPRAEQDSRFVVAVTRPVEIGLSTTERLAPIFSDDFVLAEEEADLINQVSVYNLVSVDENDSGVATVRMETESEIQRGDQQDIVAQLVWTLTELDGVDTILIEVNGEEQVIPTGDEGDVSESVEREDFPRYEREFVFPETPEETTSTTTTTASTTTVPAGDG